MTDPLTFFSTTLVGRLGSVIVYSTISAMTIARVTYYPDSGHSGSDSFAYQAVDESELGK